MAEHLISSPTHGDLHAALSRGDFGHGRSWRAVLDPRPARLAHVIAFHGMSEEEVLDGMLIAVDRYDATPLMPRRRGYPEHDEAAPARPVGPDGG